MFVQCLLWDFGDTLCDERSLWRGSPEWMDVYRSFDEGLGAAWNLGDLDTRGFVAALARRMSRSEQEILAHLSRTDLLAFFPFSYAFFRSRHLPQAIVTVNPVFFSEVIVPGCDLAACCDAVVVSGEERTIDKGALCGLALDRMGFGHDPSRALLIDNKPSNLDAWAERGGIGYLFTTDAAFERDVATGIDGLVQR